MSTVKQTAASEGLCFECQEEAASVHCPHCNLDFCGSCADRIHSLRSFQAHRPAFITIDPPALSEHKAPRFPKVLAPSDEDPWEAPSFVAVDQDSATIFVSDIDRVFLFGLDGAPKGATPSTDDARCHEPQELAVLDGSVYVGDGQFERVCVLGTDGAYRRSWPVPFKPQGLTVGDGMVFVTDPRGNRIHAYRPDGTALHSFGSSAEAKGGLSCPVGISFYQGFLFVVNSIGCSVAVFGSDGSFVRRWGSRGAGPGQLKGPSALAVHDGSVFVSDTENNRVSVFSLEGEFLRSLRGSAPPLQLPIGIAASALGLLVVDGGTGAVRGLPLDSK